MFQGTVKWFNDVKGFGFIRCDSGEELFVHYSGIHSNSAYRTLFQGEVVEFDVLPDETGRLMASNVWRCPGVAQ